MIEQAPALILLFPFFASIIVALAGIRIQGVCFPLTVISMAASVLRSGMGASSAIGTGVVVRIGTGASGSAGVCQLSTAMTATAAATPVIVLAHQNSGGRTTRSRAVSVSGVTARSDASIR